MEKEKFKWQILDMQIDGAEMKVIVEFAYGWKEMQVEGETYYSGSTARETLNLPVVLTGEQLVQYLDTYWGNKYGPLDALAQTLTELEALKGYKKSY